MHPWKRFLFFLGLLYSLILPRTLASQAAPPNPDLIQRLEEQSGASIQVAYHSETGQMRFLSAEPSHPFPVETGLPAGTASAEAVARQFLNEYGPLFGTHDPAGDLVLLQEKPTEAGRSIVRFQQVYQGIPILAGELNVLLAEGGGVLSVNGELLPGLDLEVTPRIDPSAAQQVALEQVAKLYGLAAGQLAATAPQLWIFNPALLGSPGPRRASLVWRMEVTSTDLLPLRELVLVDAHAGFVALHFNQVDSALSIRTYTANNSTSLPGTLVCDQSDPSCSAGDTHAQGAHQAAVDTYNYYETFFGRDGVDDAGYALKATVHYGLNFDNAYWDGTQIVFGDQSGWPLADDVVAHEITHAVTEYESRLFYYYQSGAINEALSDIFGELIDQWNGRGTDTMDAAWLVGEDVTGFGVLRSMADPPAFGDPDSMNSPNYFCDEADTGGVHFNSGVASKAAYLLAQSEQPSLTFNGVAVAPIGPEKTARVFYTAQTQLLLSGSDYQDLASALPQACSLLAGSHGLTPADCQQVANAVAATHMAAQPPGCAAPAAPVCPAGLAPATLFADDLETPAAGLWSSTPLAGAVDEWYYPQTANPYAFDATYATSGAFNLWGYDYGTIGDYAIELTTPVALPAESQLYLSFNHAYGFEDSTSTGAEKYDGGILEYRTGLDWNDAGPLISDNGYTGTIDTDFSNPLSGRNAFTSESNGYITTRVDLTSLAGNDVQIRFRIGTDNSMDDYGWFIDDVRIYACSGSSQPPSSFGKGSPGHGTTGISTNPTLSWSSSTGATHYEYCYDTTDDNACSTWVSTTSTNTTLSSLLAGATYYWQVRAANAYAITYANGSSTAYWSFTTMPNSSPPAAFIKLNPGSGTTGVSINPTLSWSSSSGAEQYEYCYDTTGDNDCTFWIDNGASTSASLMGLNPGAPYYWQVRASNASGTTYADGASTDFWIFITQSSTPPGSFGKGSPADGASDLPVTPTLNWEASDGAASYQYCVDTSNDSTCDTGWVSTINTIANPGVLEMGTIYFWQVRAWNSTAGPTDANEGAWWSFTTQAGEGKFYFPMVIQ